MTAQRRAGRLVRLALMALPIAILASACSGGSDSGSDKVITIGGSFSLTGAGSSYDLPLSEGLKLAVKEANDAGGLELGGEKYRVDLKIEDAKSQASVAVAGVRKLVTSDGAKIVFGNGTSDTGAAVAQYAIQAKVLYFGVFTQLENYLGKPGSELLFRMWPSAAKTNETYIPAAVKALGLSQGVTAIFPNEDVSKAVIDSADPIFKTANVPVKGRQLFQTGSTDLAPILAQVQGSGSDGLYIGYSQTDTENLVRQAITASGVPLNFITYGGSAEPGLNHKAEIKGYTWQYFTRSETSDDPAVVEWVNKYKTATGKSGLNSLDSWGMAFYDPYKALLAAMKKVGNATDLTKIAAEMHNACYDGLRSVCWDEAGRGASNYDLGVIKDGKVSVITVPVQAPGGAKKLS